MTVLRARGRLGQRGGPCFRGRDLFPGGPALDLRSRRAGACRRRGPDLFALISPRAFLLRSPFLDLPLPATALSARARP